MVSDTEKTEEKNTALVDENLLSPIDTSTYPTSFINQFRELEWTRDQALQNAENNRRNAFQNIMGSANTAGMMYSNFPERAKIQYDTATYLPAKVQAQQTFQTGLDTLRDKITKGLNQLADYNDAIASLNKQYQKSNSNLPTGAYSLNDSGDYGKQSIVNGTNFFNSKGDPIRFGTTLRHSNITDADAIMTAAQYALDEDAYKALVEAYKKARANGYNNIVINAGEGFTPNNLSFLDEGQRGLMDSLGLSFAQ